MTTDPNPHYRLPDSLHRWVNEDGERHPLENTLAFATLALGAFSVICLLAHAWEISAWTALAGGLIAAWDEFISKTSGERRIIFVGFLLCVVGVAVSSAQGAFF